MADIAIEVTYDEILCWFDQVSDFSCFFVLVDQNRTSAHH